MDVWTHGYFILTTPFLDFLIMNIASEDAWQLSVAVYLMYPHIWLPAIID